jgi:DNA gyrase/topoisomerase IV subunit B
MTEGNYSNVGRRGPVYKGLGAMNPCDLSKRYVKSKRMAWLGHVMRMEGERIPKSVLEWKPMGRKNRGRPRKRWIEDIEKDLQIMGVRGWIKLCKERAERKKITEKAKTHSGL